MVSPHDFVGLPLQDLVQALHGIRPHDFGEVTEKLSATRKVVGPRGRTMGDEPSTSAATCLLPEDASTFLPATHPEVKIPSVDLGDYLGQGAQGKVYAGVVRATGLTVAVKVVPHDDNGSGSLAVREALICSRLRHRNVVRVFDVQQCGAFWVSIMEMVQGASIADQVPSPRQMRQCFAQLADAVSFVSQHEVVHCDIKPANILCRQQDGSPVLLDFGVAVDQSLLGEATPLVGGTPLFMLPEAFSGGRPEPSWDAYALGVTAIQVATGAQAAKTLSFSTWEETRAAKVSGEFSQRLGKLLEEIPEKGFRLWCRELVLGSREQRLAALTAAQAWKER